MFGQKIKELRKSHQLTQAELASSIGISRPALSLYEAERREPDIDLLNKLAIFFNVSVDYIIGDFNDRNDIKKDATLHLNGKEYNLINTFRKLSIDNQDILIGEAKKLLKEQRREESIELTDIERKVEEAIRTQKGNLDTKIG